MPGFTPAERAALLDQLLARRAAGETFKAIAATPGWPSRPTLRKWLRRRPDLDVPPLRARPVRWSAALSRDICRRVLDGESLRAICADPAMPDRKSVLQWARARPGFAQRLADARARSGAPATGRPSRFRLTRDMVVNEICLRLCEGETGEQACAAAPDYPNPRTLYDWRRDDPDIDRKVCEASRIAAETQAQANLPDMRAYLAEVEAYRHWITETAARPPPPDAAARRAGGGGATAARAASSSPSGGGGPPKAVEGASAETPTPTATPDPPRPAGSVRRRPPAWSRAPSAAPRPAAPR